MTNKHCKHSRISDAKFREVLRCFSMDLTASDTALLTGLSRNSINKIYAKLRLHIAKFCIDFDASGGEFELDESYFGAKRVRGKRGRGAAGKTPVFGLLKRNGKVYTQVILDAKTATLMPIIERKVIPDSIVYSDCWKGYNALDVSEFKHFRINHSKLFADKENHINGIEKLASPPFGSGIRQSGICGNLMVYPRSILGYF